MGNSKRSGYTFHENFHDAMSSLPDEQYGRIMRAINEYALYGKTPGSFDGVELIVWKIIFPQLKLSRSKVNGKAGRPKKIKSKSNQNQTEIKSKSNRNQTEIKSKSNQGAETADNQQIVNENEKQLKNNQRNNIENNDAERKPPFSPLEETPPVPPKEGYPPIIPQESTRTTSCAIAAFESWLKVECPYIYGHYTLLSDAELAKLKEKYSSDDIANTCAQIENRKDLRKNYTNLYRTLLNWLKRNANDSVRTNSNASAEQRAQDAADIMARLAATNQPVV